MKYFKQDESSAHTDLSFPSGQNGYRVSLSKNRDEDKLLSFAKAHDNNDE